MNCKYCNAPLTNGSNFCEVCGKKVEQTAAGVLPSMQQRKVIQCPNKLHYYDSSVYPSCPHCANAGMQQAPAAQVAVSGGAAPVMAADDAKKKKKEKKPLFSFGKKTPQQEPAIPQYNPMPAVNKAPDNLKTVALLNFDDDEAETAVQPAVQAAPVNARKAVVRHNAVMKAETVKQAEAGNMGTSEQTPAIKKEAEAEISPLMRNEYAQPAPTPAPIPAPVKKEKAKSSDSSKTVAIYSDLSDDEPVVGWLVCVKGVYFGHSFNLAAGKNMIGRSYEMDIDLTGEDSVSRNTHATIIYEPKKRQFIIKAGDSKGLTYVNDELVLEYETLKAYDKIQLGECEMIFVPFCNENFTWDTFKNQA